MHLVPRSGALQAPQVCYFLVDGSGSMQSKWWDCLAAMDGFAATLKTQGVANHGIVSVFSGEDLQLIQRDGPIAQWQTFADDPIGSTWMGTPLFDAVNMMARHMRELDPERATICIVTDGDENCSRHTDQTQAKALLDWCRAKGWQVVFLGADFNNDRQAAALGANETNSIGVQRKLLPEAGKLLARKHLAYSSSGDEINFTKDEKSTFGGYLAAPTQD